jgi:hypothetical protein
MRSERRGLRAALPRWLEWGRRIEREAGAGLWMGAALCAALCVAAVVLAVWGPGERGTGIALRVTGRLSFLLFWPAYAGGAIAALFAPRFGILARRGRNFGLAFASAQLPHLGLVVWIGWISHQSVVEAAMPFFAVGIGWTYVLALSSVERIDNAFSPNLWRILRTVGLEYIALVFFADFVIGPIQHGGRRPIEYVPFAILLIVGSLLRIAAIVRRSGLAARFGLTSAGPVIITAARTVARLKH